jgi:hypothetical protein
MAKKKVQSGAAAPLSFDTDNQGGGSVGGYFKAIFRENPKLLKTRSNAEVLKRWQDDHPGEPEVPQRIKNILSNVKSVLRQKSRKRKQKAKPAGEPTAVAVAVPVPVVAVVEAVSVIAGFEQLEEQIDDCLTLAKNLDRAQLADVIHLLRRARNAVVWKLGQ